MKYLHKIRYEFWGILLILFILSPVLFLTFRHGVGSAIFVVHDQLDETILNYVFAARYFGQDTYPQMMCGIPSMSIRPFCPGFVVLYSLFSVPAAFLIQYVLVVISAFYGMFFLVKKLTQDGFSAILSAFLFAMLPVHSIYGNIVMGTPLLLYCLLQIRDAKKKRDYILPCLGLIFYGVTTCLALSGWAVLGFLALAIVVEWVHAKKCPWHLVLAFGILFMTYLIFNMDLVLEAFHGDYYVSHRTEYAIEKEGIAFFTSLRDILFSGDYLYEATSKHEFIIPIVIVSLILVFSQKKLKAYRRPLMMIMGAILFLAVMYAAISTRQFIAIQRKLPGMFMSFQFSRVYYFLPGLWYLALGMALHVMIEALKDKGWLSFLLPSLSFFCGFAFLVKDPDSIFHQNLTSSLNDVTRSYYVSMNNLYAEDVMEQIEHAIGKNMDTYRVIHIGICPVASLIHGFYTVDGYSNNYPLSYKQEFRTVIADELELNEDNKRYFDLWGNRCYAFYHDWGNAYMLSKYNYASIDDLHLNFQKLAEMNCKYIFSAGPITDCEKYGLIDMGAYTSDISFWRIYLYQIIDVNMQEEKHE